MHAVAIVVCTAVVVAVCVVETEKRSPSVCPMQTCV